MLREKKKKGISRDVLPTPKLGWAITTEHSSVCPSVRWGIGWRKPEDSQDV